MEEKKKEISLYDKYLEQMNLIQEKTGIPGNYVMGGLLTALLFVWIGFLERIITNLVGTVYPAFWTMKSIESKKDDDKQWLTYWVVFACFTIIDLFSGFIIQFIPFYFFLKIVFLIWLFMPNSQGSNIIYHLLVVRVFKTFEQNIDDASDKIGEYTKDFINKGSNFIEGNKEKIASGVLNKAAAGVVGASIANTIKIVNENVAKSFDKKEKSPIRTGKQTKIENPFLNKEDAPKIKTINKKKI